MLETLKFEFFDREGFSINSPIDLFAHAPCLREFSPGKFVDHTSLTLPFNQLRDIKHVYYEHNIQSSLDLLELASDVECYELRADDQSPGWELNPIQSTIELPKLHSLTAVFDGFSNEVDEGPARFFAFLHMPSIRALSLVMDKQSWELAKRHVLPLCSQPLLEKIALSACRSWKIFDDKKIMGGQHIMEILSAAKQLRSLEIPEAGGIFISADFVESFALLDSSGIPILSPNLQSLLFRHCYSINFEMLAQALMLRSLCSPLTTVTILCWEDSMADILETFRVSAWWDQLHDLGIEVQVVDKYTYATWW